MHPYLSPSSSVSVPLSLSLSPSLSLDLFLSCFNMQLGEDSGACLSRVRCLGIDDFLQDAMLPSTQVSRLAAAHRILEEISVVKIQKPKTKNPLPRVL